MGKKEECCFATFGETPILKGKDAERFLQNLANPKPLSKEECARIRASAALFYSHRAPIIKNKIKNPTKQQLVEFNKQKKALLALLLEKTGAKYRDIIDLAKQEFIASNCDILTEEEKRQFDLLVL